MARRPNVAMRKRQREQRKAEKADTKRAKRFARADSNEEDNALREDNTVVAEDSSVLEAEDAAAEGRGEPSAELFVDWAPRLTTAPGRVGTGTRLPAYCKVCRVVNDHTVVEVKSGSTKRVKCVACADEHPYRASKPVSRKRVRKRKEAAPDDGSFDSLVSGRDVSEASPYDMAAVFGDRTLINHPAFGIGVVARVLLDRKIEVLFRDGAKVLAHSR